MKKTYYYSDELNDDFAGTNIRRKELPVDYAYFSRNPIRKFFEFILYRLIVTPIIFIFQKAVFHETFKNRKVLKKYRKGGYFIYANHTSSVSDAFTPTLTTFPKKAYVIVNPDAVSLPVIGTLAEMTGGITLPTNRRGMKNFHDAVLEHAKRKHCIVIYPEAHIWPYYTKIRPFKDVSFRYPAEADKPVFCFTTTFKKRKFFNFPKETIYVDGPFFPDKNLTPKENQKHLRDLVYNAMTERSKLSSYEHREYVKVAKSSDIQPTKEETTLSLAPAAAQKIRLSEESPAVAFEGDSSEQESLAEAVV